MPRYVAFLRAINVGGSHVVKMDALRAIFKDLGFKGVETFIASGNVIFETRSKDVTGLERRIEVALEMILGYEVATFIRTLDEIASIARAEPFPAATLAKAGSFNVGLLKGPLPDASRRLLAKLTTDVDDFRAIGSELYWLCIGGQGGSKISNAVFERTLKVKATFRGMRTMEKLAAKYPPTS